MKSIKQFIRELTAIGRNPKVLIPVIGVLIIPVLYSAMFLNAFWDPYDKLEDLPVAVVNSDTGTEYNGSTMHIGQDFADKLKESGDFSYHFVSKEEANDGLNNNKYYMAVEIPEDFSKKTTTLTTDNPTQAEIVFLPNESYNFLAAQIGNTAIEKMRTELNKEVTKAYTRTVFEQFENLADGLNQASEGAAQIAEGTDNAKNGASLIEENIGKLTSGSYALQDGMNKVVNGSNQLESGIADLDQGSVTLASGLTQLSDASSKLKQGAVQTQQGADQLSISLTQSAEGALVLETGMNGLTAGLEQLSKDNPELLENEQYMQLIATSKQLSSGATAAKEGQEQLAAGAKQVHAGTAQLASSLEQFGVKLNSARDGGAQLATGVKQLHDGAIKLNAGMGSLSEGINAFTTGSSKLDLGAQEMTKGLIKLGDGTGELSSKLSDAALKTANINGGDSVVDMFASPVNLSVEKQAEVPNYGTGFAPYFISLGLFVGALLLTIVYSVKEPAVKPTSAWSWFISKWLTLVIIGIVQALIVDLVLIFGLGLEVQSLPLFILFSIIASLTFMTLIQFLVTVFQHPGRFMAIIILIFQLTSSAGTFPMELIPSWLQGASTWLPMTYSVAGFKAVVSSGDFSFMWDNAGVLIGFAAIFAVLTFVYYTFAYRKEVKGELAHESSVTA